MDKILVITSGRADYGLLYWLMRNIEASPNYELQIIATGMHLSPEFGSTYQKIEEDGFTINHKVELLLSSDTNEAMSKSMGLGMIGFSSAFEELQPDLIVVLGDRFEIFAAVATAMMQKFPIAHIHGGEVTQGAIDDALRHSITKMSNLHFCATADYRRRIIQLGENPKNVHLVGGLGLDFVNNVDVLSRDEIEKRLDFKLLDQNVLITYHPETLSNLDAKEQINELLQALSDFKHLGLIFTMPNADSGGRVITEVIKKFVDANPNARLYDALGQELYLSCIASFDGVVGNSSSGILEVPSFKKGTLNIGSRQEGRDLADSVVSCSLKRSDIKKGLDRLLSENFQNTILNTVNPYGDGGASDKIVKILQTIDFSDMKPKIFVDHKITEIDNLQ